MAMERKNLLSFSTISMILVSLIMPAYAEVTSLQSDRIFYVKGDTITFSGIVDDDSKGLVTIVIRDPSDEFVLLAQAMVQPDNSYTKTVNVGDKFALHGIYNATAFIYNMTAGSLTQFDFSLDGSPVTPSVYDFQSNFEENSVSQKEVETTEETPKIADFVDLNKDPKHYINRYTNEPTYKDWFDRNFPGQTIFEVVGIPEPEQELTNIIPHFPNPNMDPQHYINRYTNEPTYKDWFDRNFPGQTIFEVVGIPEPEKMENHNLNSTIPKPVSQTQESVVNTASSSFVSSIGNEFSQTLLALGGLGILFGAVYGIKRRVDSNTERIIKNKEVLQRRVDHNSEQISQNRFWLKRKLMNLKPCDASIKLIKERLAKGEIPLDEYYRLLTALKKQ